MKPILIVAFFLSILDFSQAQTRDVSLLESKYVVAVPNLTLEAAFELHKQASQIAAQYNKNVSVAILDA